MEERPLVDQPVQVPTGEIGSKATITFSTANVTGPETRFDVNPREDVKTLHLIVFDENGMLVEVCQATELGSSNHHDHTGGRHYTVTLTVTDQPRIIHYVANCPVDQVVYGHETSIIGNMYVDRNELEEYQTEFESSYWARIEVPFILVETKEREKEDGTKEIVISLHEDIIDKFMHVPLLRNFAEITVSDETDNTFIFEGFTVYNLLNRGTVAPYNSNTQEFQNFFYNPDEGGIRNYSYPEISGFGYEGHALTSAKLVTDFVRNDDGTIKIYKADSAFHVYERKVSVMTDAEELWRESPPHIIIKGRYNDGEEMNLADSAKYKIYYYKMDLVYTEKDAVNGTQNIKYYNILRNFRYKFSLQDVYDRGYDKLEEAVAGAAGNNISGSSSTSKLTNVSDNDGRLWVSHTDVTLVTNEDVIFRYKYIPNYYGTEGNQYVQGEVRNDLVKFDDIDGGEVIREFNVATTDITSGEWAGYREVTISVNAPDDIIRQQIVSVKTNNANLNRQIRYTLRKKLTMEVECTPKVPRSILQEMTVNIKLPLGMTDDMFPLELNMETEDRTLSPDASKNSIPVTAGPSIIEDRDRELSYYYTVIIPTFENYKALADDGNMKVYTTYWKTNKADNASTFYVANKYFNQASDSWENYQYVFSNASCTTSALGVGQNVNISFTMANGAINTPVTISLKGMTYTGTLGGVTYNNADTVRYTPSSKDVSISGFKTTTATDNVSFTLNADDYNIFGPVMGERQTYKFNGAFVGVTRLEEKENVEIDFTFDIPQDAFDALTSLSSGAKATEAPMFVILDRMHPADDQLVYSQAKAGGDRYIYRIKHAGTQTIKLATTEAVAGICSVTLQANYFDTQTVSVVQSNIVTYAGTIKITDANLSFNNQLRTNNSYSSSAKYSIIVGDKTVVENQTLTSYETSRSSSGQRYYITGINSFTIENVSISGADISGDTNVEIEITITTNYDSRTVKYSGTIDKLLDLKLQ